MKAAVIRIHRLDDEATYQLVKGIPIPPRPHKAQSKLGKTLRAMQVGDSFLVKGKGISGPHRAADRAGIKITCRRQDGYIRIWRIA